MTKKFPSWTPEKDQMLLCAAHVHRDPTNGHVRWKEVAMIVAQGVHSPKSCCGRHTRLIKDYTTAERALRQTSEVDVSSQHSTPVSSPLKPRASAKKLSSDKSAAAKGKQQEVDSSSDSDDSGASSSDPQEESSRSQLRKSVEKTKNSEDKSKAKQKQKEKGKEKAPSTKGTKRIATGESTVEAQGQGDRPKKKNKNNHRVGGQPGQKTSCSAPTQSAREASQATSTANIQPDVPSNATSASRTLSPSIPTGPAVMRPQLARHRSSGSYNQRIQHTRPWHRQGNNQNSSRRPNEMEWMNNVLQTFKRGVLNGLKHEMGMQ